MFTCSLPHFPQKCKRFHLPETNQCSGLDVAVLQGTLPQDSSNGQGPLSWSHSSGAAYTELKTRRAVCCYMFVHTFDQHIFDIEHNLLFDDFFSGKLNFMFLLCFLYAYGSTQERKMKRRLIFATNPPSSRRGRMGVGCFRKMTVRPPM